MSDQASPGPTGLSLPAEPLLDPGRLAALHRSGLLDSPPEEAFERLTRLAARLLRAPVALVSLLDERREYFRSAVGYPEPWASRRETPAPHHALCRHVAASGRPLVVEDVRLDPVLQQIPGMHESGVVAYAGVPITLTGGAALGAVCAIDRRPRSWELDEVAILHDLAGIVADEIERREISVLLHALLESSPDPISVKDRRGRYLLANSATARTVQQRLEAVLGKTDTSLFSPEVAQRIMARDRDILESGNPGASEEAINLLGTRRTYLTSRSPLHNGRGEIVGVVGISKDITEWKRAEEAVRASEAHYRLLFDANPHPMWVLDAETLALLAVNDAAVQHYGYTREEFLAMTLPDLGPGEDAESLRRHVGGAGSPGRGADQVWQHQKRDGTRISVRILSHGLAYRGRAARLAVAEDVTARRAAKQALERERSFVSAVLDTVGALVVVLDPEGRIVRFNRTAERTTGYPASEVVGRRFWEIFLPPAEAEEVRAGFANLRAGQPPRERESHWLTKWGESRLVASSGTALPGEDGGPDYIVLTGVDVTERRRAERELRASEERYRTFLEQTAEAVWRYEIDPPLRTSAPEDEQIRHLFEHARIADCNDAMARMYGFGGAADVIGRRLGDLIDPTDPGALEYFRRFLRSGYRITDSEFRERSRSGRPRQFLSNVLGIVRGGCVATVWGTQRDVTERRELEEQLRQAQKMEAMGRLAGGIAHDFNNLLTAILSYSEMALSDRDVSPPLREDIEQIRQAGRRAAELTNQLLAFSRRQVLQLRPVDLNGVVLGVDRMLRRLIGEDVELVTELAPDLRPALGDPGQLEQVVMNLAVNARDAMPTGGRLTLTTGNVTVGEDAPTPWGAMPPGTYATLAVRDTGSGMDPDTLARVFEPFFTTKGPGSGTGLGLATVYGSVQQSGGHIRVQSRPGAGSTFTVFLPVVETPAELREVALPAAPVQGEAEIVLLVEDETLVRHLTREVLTRNGYRVLEAVDGLEALDLCRSYGGTIDLMITDVVMPRLGGRELVEQVRPSRPDMRVLYVSGYSEEAIERQGRLTEGIELLPKPYTPGVLTAKVRQILDRRS